MRFIAVSLFLPVIALTSCGKDQPQTTQAAQTSCASLTELGTWHDSAHGDVLTIHSDCTATDSYCGQSISFSVPSFEGAAVNVHIATTNSQAGCLALGDHVCVFAQSGLDLAVRCEGGILQFSR